MPSITTAVVGSNHYPGAMEALRRLKRGDRVELRPQPTNQYDRNAVEVFSGRQKLGYVPRADSALVSKVVSCGLLLEAFVSAATTTIVVKWRDPKEASEEAYVERGADILG